MRDNIIKTSIVNQELIDKAINLLAKGENVTVSAPGDLEFQGDLSLSYSASQFQVQPCLTFLSDGEIVFCDNAQLTLHSPVTIRVLPEQAKHQQSGLVGYRDNIFVLVHPQSQATVFYHPTAESPQGYATRDTALMLYQLVSKPEDLYKIGRDTPLDANYVLTQEISITDKHQPLTNDEQSFLGLFDGQNHCLTVSLFGCEASAIGGLFYNADDAIIRNLKLIINGHFGQEVDVGGVVGTGNKITIENVHVGGAIHIGRDSQAAGIAHYLCNSRIINASFSGKITAVGLRSHIAGIVAKMTNETVLDCVHSSGQYKIVGYEDTDTIIITDSSIGGLVAFSNKCTISNSASLASLNIDTVASYHNVIVGGLCGSGSGTILLNCYVDGTLECHNSVKQGAFFGEILINTEGYKSNVEKCYWTEKVSFQQLLGNSYEFRDELKKEGITRADSEYQLLSVKPIIKQRKTSLRGTTWAQIFSSYSSAFWKKTDDSLPQLRELELDTPILPQQFRGK